jgi:hypothetical protein
MFQVSRFVFWNFLFGVPVTCSRNQNCSVDYETAKIFESLLEARDCGIGRPEIRTQILREVLR